jgi:hypothetical protein
LQDNDFANDPLPVCTTVCTSLQDDADSSAVNRLCSVWPNLPQKLQAMLLSLIESYESRDASQVSTKTRNQSA